MCFLIFAAYLLEIGCRSILLVFVVICESVVVICQNYVVIDELVLDFCFGRTSRKFRVLIRLADLIFFELHMVKIFFITNDLLRLHL